LNSSNEPGSNVKEENTDCKGIIKKQAKANE